MSALLTTLLVLTTVPAAEDLLCLSPQGNPPPAQLFYSDLQQQAYVALDRRQQAYDQLKTADQIRDYQQKLRATMIRQLGGFPERSPLNAQVVGRLAGPGYRVEKVIFDSQPRHRITAALFLPEGSGPFPGVLVSSGHSRTAKTAGYNQKFGIALARHGIAALCYDPIGQGERSQLLTADGKPQHSGTTTEHFLVGYGAILTGTSTARYRIWDGIRAIDYLASRPDIDVKRIGFTGCSGGGTLTSYVMALDDRVACSAPACYLTTFRRLIETIGPQDAEQNIFGQLAVGLDQTDYVLMRAPKPTLISSTTGDFFDIRGSWDTFRQAKRIYARLGLPEGVDLVEAEGTHGVQPANLTAIVRWMRRWLLNKDDAVELADMTVHAEAELLCTDKGQVLLLPDEKSVFDLNAERAKSLAENRRTRWAAMSPEQRRQAIRETAGIRAQKDLPVAELEKGDAVQRDGYHIDKGVLRVPGRAPLPMLTYHPKKPQQDTYLYLHAGGKHADGTPGGPIEKLVGEGFVVVAIDLSGIGETQPGKPDPLLGDWKTFFMAYLVGKSLVGIRAEDALIAQRWGAYYERKEPRKIHLVGVGSAAVPALHAAAVEPEAFASVTLRDLPPAWSSQLDKAPPAGAYPLAVHNVLSVYDLPDLQTLIDPARLKSTP